MGGYRLTVRRGPKVNRARFERLEDAIAELRRQAEEIQATGTLPTVTMLREFEPGERVSARLEISTGGWLRGHAAGVDVMGDGSVVPFRGGIARSELEPRRGESVFDAVRRALSPGVA
jgi:hypothetical protein